MKRTIIDGNAAASYVSYAFSEVAVIYPITPSSPMAELADEWSAKNKPNLFGQVPNVVQMQSESGVAGALHGALTCGALATTYTCSQGLLLMLPDMYKIAGELLPTVIHVSARAIATHALSIFGDHQDVMACRQTGFAMLCSSSPQEVADLAVVAHIATLKSSVPFLHFFDGFRTSHEINVVETLEYDELNALFPHEDIHRFRARGLTPNAPSARGTTQNPDVYFQNRERANPYYLSLPKIVQKTMDEVAKYTKRHYHVFDYFGAPDAQTVAVMMGSGALTMQETIEKENENGGKYGLIQVRLYRPFDGALLRDALPQSCKRVIVLDRTKEAGALGEPLYLDVCAALKEGKLCGVEILGGRYGLGQKEFTPAQAFAALNAEKNHFTVGICDDVSHSSLPVPKDYHIPSPHVACKFYGLGSDGTVGANKNSVKIIGERPDASVQGYFYYDSKKSGGVTISHLRYGKTPIRAPYLVDNADFIACHNPSYLTRYDMLSQLKDGGTFLLNCPWGSIDELSANLPDKVKRALAKKRAKLFVIDGTALSLEVGLRGRTSTVMQTAFFLLRPDIMPYAEATERLKTELSSKFAHKGQEVLESNLSAVEQTAERVREITVPSEWANLSIEDRQAEKTEYFDSFIQPILTLEGDSLPVSAFTADGSVPTGTTKLEYHGTAELLPEWIPENCIQCNRCSFVCPHACIRPYLLENGTEKPDTFVTKPATGLKDMQFRIQVFPRQCMGCGVCANVCPTKDKSLVMRPSATLAQREDSNLAFAKTLNTPIPQTWKRSSVKGSQFYPPLFEFSYACAGCGETPYIKVLTQLFGEKMLIANATGCSSIYGGSAPTCPYTTNKDGNGPAWANSLFEDNAEFGMGMRLAWNARGEKDKSVWIIGGDGWAYDIGYGGLDHLLASDCNVNVLVLDSEVYSNTGGQASKATPMGAVARFAAAGKSRKKKNLGLMAMSYANAYVAQVSIGADMQQLLTALTEAEAHDGPSLVIAYTPCIAHGVNMERSMHEAKRAVDCGYWQLYRFNPNATPAFRLDSKTPTLDFKAFLEGENRFARLMQADPKRAEVLFSQAETDAKRRFEFYQNLERLFRE